MSVVNLRDVCLLLLLSGFISPPLVKCLPCTDTRQFGETHFLQLNLSSNFHSVCYKLNSTTQKEAINVFVESEGALVQHPVLVTVKQPKGVRSWSIPYVETGFAYRSVDRTLCPLLNIVDSGEAIIHVDLSTLSETTLNITLRLTTVENYKLELNTPAMLSASPSHPSYLLFDYPPDVTRVRVKFTSTDDTSGICAIASLQTAYCPEVELINNREARGKYQTLKSIASINAAEYARGSNFGFFYVVLTVFPNNGREDNCDFTTCGYEEMVMLDDNAKNYHPLPSIGEERVKRVNVTVELALTDNRYYIIMGVTLGLFSLFYLFTCTWIFVFDWWRYDTSPKYSILKRGQSVFLEGDLEQPHISRFDSLIEPDKPDSSVKKVGRPTLGSSKSVENIGRPTLLSVMIGVHWKHAAARRTSSRSGSPIPDPQKPIPSENTPSTTPHSETTHSKALKRQLRVPPDSSAVRNRLMTPLNTKSEPNTEIDGGGISDPGPASSEQGGNAAVGLQGKKEKFDKAQEIERKDFHVSWPNRPRIETEKGEVPEEKTRSYKYDGSAFPVKVLLSELGEIDENQKVFDNYPLFVLVIAVFYAIPAFQLVLTYRWITATGNEDVCYYNNLCSHPWEMSSGLTLSSFNNLFSNIGYFALGLLLILIARRRRQMYQYYVNRNYTRAPEYRFGVPQQFGLFYAMGMGMMAQAMLSAAYHICPTRDNFRLDSTFMYFIPALSILKLEQGRSPERIPDIHRTMLVLTVIALSVVVGLVSYDNHTFWHTFFIFQVLSPIMIVVQLYYRWQLQGLESFKTLFNMYKNEGIFPPRNKPRFVLAALTLTLNWAFALYGLLERPSKFGMYILADFLTNFALYLVYYIVTKRIYREIQLLKTKTTAFGIAALLCYAVGLYFYTQEPTDWQLSPAVSRSKNLECVLFGFYDVHDVWHFLSGFGLFFSGLVLMTMDDTQEVWSRKRLLTF